MATTKVRKAADNIPISRKYKIIEDYLDPSLSVAAIAEKYNTTPGAIENVVRRHYQSLQNVRETRVLISSQSAAGLKVATSSYLNPDKINEQFLEKLSEPDSLYLTDNEMVFAELFNFNGDEIQALEEAKLNGGLHKPKDKGDREEYYSALKLRAFYLRRKPNVVRYLEEIQKEKLKTIVEGKGFIQSQLLSIMEKVKNLDSERAAMTHLKCIEQLGRTLGAFEENINITGLDGDSAIDRILQKARDAKATVIEQEEDAENI